MMKLQTQLSIPQEKHNPIDYHSNILLIGSCFSENIGEKFKYFKFDTTQNPLGILFHPKAIERLITNAINKKEYSEKDVFFLNERWHCFDAHSSLSSTDKEALLSNLNEQIKVTNTQLKASTHIIITLGTAWLYRYIETSDLVANCHKVPQKKFLKELLSVEEVTESLDAIITLIKSVKKNASIIFTVSPVRHLKDGIVQNQQSKSHLISAIYHVIEPRKSIHYFPSYELMMDELRDYRFYAEDMIHPNKTAINYIWNKFSDAWISEEATAILKEISSIQNGLSHRPFNPNSEQHQQFLKNLGNKIENLKKKYPYLNLI